MINTQLSKRTKIGDLFSVEVGGGSVKYFQLVAFDPTQLNSDVIRVFGEAYPIGSPPELREIVSGEVSFYAHCVTKLGLKMNLWQKVGNVGGVGDISTILFRGTDDYGSKVGEDPVKVSDNWYVWRIGDEDFTYVGRLKGVNRKAEIGLVVNPIGMVHKIKTGNYIFPYPSFE